MKSIRAMVVRLFSVRALAVIAVLVGSAAQAQSSYAGPMFGWVDGVANPSCSRPVGGSTGDVGGELNWRGFYDTACVVDGKAGKWSVDALSLNNVKWIRNWAGASSCTNCDSWGRCDCTGNNKALEALSSTTVGLRTASAGNSAQYWSTYQWWGGVACPGGWSIVVHDGRCLYSSTDSWGSHANLVLATCPSTCPSTGGFLFWATVGF